MEAQSRYLSPKIKAQTLVKKKKLQKKIQYLGTSMIHKDKKLELF